MEKPETRKVSLAGLGLLSAGAVLGIALATPASAATSDDARPPRPPASQVVESPGAEQD
ncbi:hypothetical protein ACIA5D_11660 [Actinoplanes sp. NPDC051513]|uniref:hypothetical protein n=1 Tax=Actinoplanes sp. NPDC051513 TaxID=3363908 RepID=UPI0037BA8BB5